MGESTRETAMRFIGLGREHGLIGLYENTGMTSVVWA